MTDQKETTDGPKKKLSLSRPGKLELNKTVDAGQVRQSFSHGRTKSVAVEVRRKRTFKQADDGAMTEIREKAPVEEAPKVEKPVEQEPAKKEEAPARTLTDQERAARTRALEGARQTETEIAESRAEREAMEARRREEESAAREQEEQRRKEEEERRRAEEEERHRLERNVQ